MYIIISSDFEVTNWVLKFADDIKPFRKANEAGTYQTSKQILKI